MTPPDWMVLGAVRYATGRMSYVVGTTCDWLAANWGRLEPQLRGTIARDLEEEFEADDRARAEGRAYKPLGMDMDRAQWERVRALYRAGGGGPEVG